MPLYRQVGIIPEKRHIVFRQPNGNLYHEELFGPVASFYRVRDEQAAIDLVNDLAFG